MTAKDERLYPRFGFGFRILHIMLFTGVILASASGIPLKFAHADWAKTMTALMGGVEMRALIHKFAAVLLIAVGVAHLLSVLIVDNWRRPFWRHPMMVRLGDVLSFFQDLAYLVGRRAERAPQGRFSWHEKFDYWGAWWGMVILIGTGLVMWFKEVSLQYLSLAGFQVLWLVHGDEAMLAVLFLFIVHIYNVHANPEVFPMSTVWLHGKISMERMQREHSLELAEAAVEPLPPLAPATAIGRLDAALRRINLRVGMSGPLVALAVALAVYILGMRYLIGLLF